MNRITLIRPNMTGVRSTDALEPLALAILAGMTPEEIEVELIDERLEAIRYDDSTDLAAISVETFTARNAYQIATRFRQRGVRVVLGGCHPTFLPKEALAYADAVVVGDAEGLWPEVIRDARAGRLKPVYRRSEPPALDGMRVDRSVFRRKRYAPVTPVQFGRGCRFGCDFCSIHALYGNTLRQRPVDEVVREIGEIGCRNVFFVDDNLFIDPARAEEFFRALRPLKIGWTCQVSIDVTRNTRLLDLMAQSGCHAVVVGF
ncbi:MAG: radical SAM protein, partial [Planctomycetota bacterium]